MIAEIDLKYIKKVGLLVYLFLCFSLTGKSSGNDSLLFNTNEQLAYNHILRLDFQLADSYLHGSAPASLYLKSLSESLQLVISEDQDAYNDFEEHHDKRLSALKRIKEKSPAVNLFVAEMHLHSAFVDLKFGHEFQSAWQIKRAYRLINENAKKYPDFIYNNKALGLLHVIIGSVPQKYQWIVSLFGMEGSIADGLSELQSLSNRDNTFQTESRIIQALIQSYLLGKPEVGLQVFGQTLQSDPENEFFAYVNVLLLMKNQQSQDAEIILEDLMNSNLKISLLNYVAGEVYLQQGEFEKARAYYEKFLNSYKGASNVKDAHYKIFLTAYLQKSEEAPSLKQKAINISSEVTEADKYATKVLLQENDLNPIILRIRLLTDGGFYEKAEALIASGIGTDFPYLKDKVEYEYRKARLAHSRHLYQKAIESYLLTVDLAGKKPWYFVANSCLQLGHLYTDRGDVESAKKYYNQVFEYKNYQYQKSIENKAKSALSSLD